MIVARRRCCMGAHARARAERHAVGLVHARAVRRDGAASRRCAPRRRARSASPSSRAGRAHDGRAHGQRAARLHDRRGGRRRRAGAGRLRGARLRPVRGHGASPRYSWRSVHDPLGEPARMFPSRCPISLGPRGCRRLRNEPPEEEPMGKLYEEISVSLDGYVAGPNISPDNRSARAGSGSTIGSPALASWKESHGQSGGRSGPDDELMKQSIARGGAVIMGKNMFGPGQGAPSDDGSWQGWWGDDPPFHQAGVRPAHQKREPLQLSDTTFTFVNGGPEAALEQARAAAGDDEVQIAGGASAIQQYLRRRAARRALPARGAGAARRRRAAVRQPRGRRSRSSSRSRRSSRRWRRICAIASANSWSAPAAPTAR